MGKSWTLSKDSDKFLPELKQFEALGITPKWKWRHRFFWTTDRNSWTEIFRPAVEPGDTFLIELWPESCCFSDWPMGDPENCHGDIRITVPKFPIHCESESGAIESHPWSCYSSTGDLASPTELELVWFPRGKRNASHRWFNAMHDLDYFTSVTEGITQCPKHSFLVKPNLLKIYTRKSLSKQISKVIMPERRSTWKQLFNKSASRCCSSLREAMVYQQSNDLESFCCLKNL